MRSAALVLAVLSLFLLGSCAQQYVCPAYQSAFIYDQAALQKQFSYFVNDSTPKRYAVRKTKYLIAEPVSYRKRNRDLSTIKLAAVMPVKVDSSKADSSRLRPDSLALARKDSLDTFYKQQSGLVKKSVNFKITQTKEKYNSDQEYYMWFFRRTLVLPDVRYAILRKEQGLEEPAAPSSATTEDKKSNRSFFQRLIEAIKGLFKRKEKVTPVGTNTAP